MLTASRWMEIRPALRDSIGTRIELRLNDPTDSEINRRLATAIPAGTPGRGLAAPGLYFHLALPRMDGAESTEGLREAQLEILDQIGQAWRGAAAPPIRLLPARIDLPDVLALPARSTNAGASVGVPTGIPIGIAQRDLGQVEVDLATDESHLLVFGDSGRARPRSCVRGSRRWSAAGRAGRSGSWSPTIAAACSGRCRTSISARTRRTPRRSRSTSSRSARSCASGCRRPPSRPASSPPGPGGRARTSTWSSTTTTWSAADRRVRCGRSWSSCRCP
ncbi:FtsK/SpoIIIE domain-containing protein [Fodinicola feengrottensis]|uniref:FtsK/SpoIIIE domain-containing protein n=1 Tax=Fodinicola feengrottensis TaxID=435914 RepID=UPI0013D05C73|nr:FtsK/SpoIIIE domain-containing protein [Fodinicola feengrottensis]